MRMIRVETCRTCPNLSHSGGFTIGGARPVCGGASVPKTQEEADARVPPEVLLSDRAIRSDSLSLDGNLRYHWRYRQLPADHQIPEWCPLEKMSGDAA